MMKNILTTLVLSLLTVLLPAQVEVELTIENQRVIGTDFLFDIYLKTTAGTTGDLFLGNADFVLTFDEQNFTGPVVSKDPSGTPGNNTFIPTNGTPTNIFITQINYFDNTSPTLSGGGDEIIINLNGPTPADQTAFDGRVAKIDGVGSMYRLGSFKVSGISTSSGFANLAWRTSGGGVVTQVFTLQNTSPFTSTAANIVATNPANFPLPVTLTNFSAQAVGESIELDWQSEREENFEGYELQRSTDGKDFSPITFLPAEGGDFRQNYRYVDTKVQPGVTYYYRLKMLDLDGTFTFSPVRSAKIEGGTKKGLRISPNPARGRAMIEFDALRAGAYSLQMFNEKGGMVYEKHYDLEEGENQLVLNAGRFPSGSYFVKIGIGEDVLSGKLILAGQ